MALRPELARVLACPCDEHGALEPGTRDGAEVLTCTACGRSFPFDGDIPVLLLDDAWPPEATDPPVR